MAPDALASALEEDLLMSGFQRSLISNLCNPRRRRGQRPRYHKRQDVQPHMATTVAKLMTVRDNITAKVTVS